MARRMTSVTPGMAGMMTLGGMDPVFPSKDTKLAEPLASTPPPLPGAV